MEPAHRIFFLGVCVCYISEGERECATAVPQKILIMLIGCFSPFCLSAILSLSSPHFWNFLCN